VRARDHENDRAPRSRQWQHMMAVPGYEARFELATSVRAAAHQRQGRPCTLTVAARADALIPCSHGVFPSVSPDRRVERHARNALTQALDRKADDRLACDLPQRLHDGCNRAVRGYENCKSDKFFRTKYFRFCRSNKALCTNFTFRFHRRATCPAQAEETFWRPPA